MKKTLTVVDASSLIIGIVIGVGIFKAPSLVALHTGNTFLFFSVWIAGGAISLIGALCYAELATAYPHPGGDYHYLTLAFGKKPAFLFAWARMTVMQTGSIAMLAFILGDYLSQVAPLGAHSSSIYAAASIAVLTFINAAGIKEGRATQKLLTLAIVTGILFIAAGGLFFASPLPSGAPPSSPARPLLGLTMVFVLLTYGGWNEAAYISAELREPRKNMVHSLIWSISIITLLYLLINLTYWKVLGMHGTASSNAVAYDVMARITGSGGAALISLIVAVSALSSMNGVIITGSRTNYALGKEFLLFRFLGRWYQDAATPVHALVVQGIISLLLVVFGTLTMKGFVTMVEFTAPVFWFFFFLTTVSLIVLRLKDPKTLRPFHAPLYPVTPILFCCVCLFMLISSIQYTGIGALAGIVVLCAGIPFLMISRYHNVQEK
jgi:amino acid transporter